MTDTKALLELAVRCEAATGPDRELDGDIAEIAYGWKLARVPPDANGENAGETLTPDGKPFRKPDGGRWVYPPLGRVSRTYHCEEYTRDCRDPAFPRDAIRQQTAAALRAQASALREPEEAARRARLTGAIEMSDTEAAKIAAKPCAVLDHCISPQHNLDRVKLSIQRGPLGSFDRADGVLLARLWNEHHGFEGASDNA